VVVSNAYPISVSVCQLDPVKRESFRADLKTIE